MQFTLTIVVSGNVPEVPAEACASDIRLTTQYARFKEKQPDSFSLTHQSGTAYWDLIRKVDEKIEVFDLTIVFRGWSYAKDETWEEQRTVRWYKNDIYQKLYRIYKECGIEVGYSPPPEDLNAAKSIQEMMILRELLCRRHGKW